MGNSVCARCGEDYVGDPAKLALGNRLCKTCQDIPRSTCFDTRAHHAPHVWGQPAKRWCPGTGKYQRPQVPDALRGKR